MMRSAALAARAGTPSTTATPTIVPSGSEKTAGCRQPSQAQQKFYILFWAGIKIFQLKRNKFLLGLAKIASQFFLFGAIFLSIK